jgi:hypothetical protein
MYRGFRGWFLGLKQIESEQFYRVPLYIGDVLYSREVYSTPCHHFLHCYFFTHHAVDQRRVVSLSLCRQSKDLHRCQVNQVSKKYTLTIARGLLLQ